MWRLEIAVCSRGAGRAPNAPAPSVLSKLGLRNRVQAVVLAYETGLVTPGA